MILWLLYSLFTGTLVVAAWTTTYPPSKSKCQPITVAMCRTNESKYDQTRLPNFLGFLNQNAVNLFTEQTEMKQLVKTKCSKDLVFFLCSVLLPICISKSKGDRDNKLMNYMVPPCRSLCERVHGDCIGSIKKLNFSWPGKLNCSGLPDHNGGICISPDAFVSTTPTVPVPSRKPFILKAMCARSGSRLRRKNVDLNSGILKTLGNNYIFRVRSEGKRVGSSNTPVVEVLAQSACTSTQLNPVTQLLLHKPSCRRKFRKDDGEVLILVKKGKKQLTIEMIILKMKKNDVKNALQKHVCSSKKRNNNKRQTGKLNG